MNPAPSVLIFTTFSGMGLGLLALLGLGLPAPQGWAAFFHWGLAYGLTVGGLLSSTLHLGHPERAWRALSQWRSSWLSREGIAAIATLICLAPMALSDWLGWGLPRAPGWVGAGLALSTLGTTAMIYTQLKTVPRWNNPTTLGIFLAYGLTGGALAAGQAQLALAFAPLLALALVAHFTRGDRAFSEAGQTLGKATGLGRIGRVQVFEQPHTAPNYLMREMIFHVGRKHVTRLRLIALTFSAALPFLALLFLPATPALCAALTLLHLIGALAQRWLFFAQAEHVVGLFYGAHQD